MEKIKLFLQKPLYKSIKVWHVLVVLIVLASFGESETKKTQPEQVRYYPTEIDIRTNWELVLDWFMK